MSDQNNRESQLLIQENSNYAVCGKYKAFYILIIAFGAGFLVIACGITLGYAFHKHGEITEDFSRTIKTNFVNNSIPPNIQECVEAPYIPLTIDEIRLTAENVSAILQNTADLLNKAEQDWLLQLAPEKDTMHRKHVRKELRTLTEEEWMRYARALKAMTQSYPSNDSRSEYNIFVSIHAPGISPTAHFGPTLLLWHRVYLDKFEAALARHEPDVSLPYWDTVLDDYLPAPEDSVVWTESLLGPNAGPLTTGVFAGHKTMEGYCAETLGEVPFRNLTSIRKTRIDTLLSNNIIEEAILNRTTFSDVMKPVEVNYTHDARSLIETRHNGVHVFIGGHMRDVPCSPNDPMFWIWHSFLDNLFEEFRAESQSTDRKTDYFFSPDINPSYAPNVQMNPFAVPNIWGLSDHFTSYRYSFEKRPSKITCTNDSECGSSREYLWCNECGQCVSKVRVGGDCMGLPNKACYCAGNGRGKCLNGRCQCAQ